jgi:hypothetical protein
MIKIYNLRDHAMYFEDGVGPDDLNQGVGTTDAVFVENPTLKRLKEEKMKAREKRRKSCTKKIYM